MAYNLIGRRHVDDWFAGREPDEIQAMALWLKAVLSGPLEVASGAFEQARTGRTMYWAHVPNTNSIVTYVVFDAPVRAVSIISVIPAP